MLFCPYIPGSGRAFIMLPPSLAPAFIKHSKQVKERFYNYRAHLIAKEQVQI